MKLESLRDLFVDELKDLYNAEHQLLKALPKMAKAATATDLKRAFESHLKETKGASGTSGAGLRQPGSEPQG